METLREDLPASLNPYPWYQSMRETAPVHFDPDAQLWQVFRYADVERVITDYQTFSSAIPIHPELQSILVVLDPPRHDRLRRLVSQAFTPHAIARLAPRISALVEEYLDRVAPLGAMDVVDDLASPLVIVVIAELIGVPIADQEQFRIWAATNAAASSVLDAPLQTDMIEYLQRLIAQRRCAPQEDLVSALIAAQVDGQHLTEQEIVSFCMVLLLAGGETSMHLISWAVHCLDAYPATLEQVRTNRSLLPALLEETARYRTPFPGGMRRAIRETKVGDQTIREGQLVLALLGSANRDERQFTHPNTFDIQRSPNPHLGFGRGIHYCLGAPLGRLEATIAISALLDRFTELRRVREKPLEPVGNGFVYGLKHLPIAFRPTSTAVPFSRG